MTPERELLRDFPGIRFEKDYNDWLFKRDALLASPERDSAIEQTARKCAEICREAVLGDEDCKYDNQKPIQDGDGTAFNRGVVACDRYIVAHFGLASVENTAKREER